MPSANDSWGIEIGANAIKALRLQRTGSDVSIADYDVIPFKKVLTTPEIDVDETIRLGLDQFQARHQVGKAAVVASIAGHRAFARFAKLPPVEPKKVPDIVKFEAVQQIPFPIEEVEWDYQTFQNPDSPDVEVGIFAITKERVVSWLGHFQAVGIPVHGLTLSPVAIYNGLAYDLEMDDDSPGTILLDIGTMATDLIIVDAGRIWLRTIPIGGHHFTEALVRSFKLGYSKAEKLKREARTSKYARQIFQAMRPVFVDLVSEIQKSLGYYQSLNRDAELKQLYGLGSTIRLPGLQKFLKQQLQIEVSRLDGFKRIEVEGRRAAAFAEHAGVLCPAYGLALQGLSLEKVSCSVLPTSIIRQEVWRAKQPWTIAAAVIIAASAGIGYTRLMLDRQAYHSNTQDKKSVARVLKQADAYVKDWNEIAAGGTDPRLQIENIRRVLDYRNVWPAILQDVNEALMATKPQPELLTADPDQIKKVPRKQRRRVFVERVDYEYVFSGKKRDAEKIWGERQYLGDATLEATSSAAEPATPPPGRKAKDADMLPSYVITLTGTTPNERADEFLTDTFVQALIEREARMRAMDEKHREDPTSPPRDRPYRIVDVQLKEVFPVQPSGEEVFPTPGDVPSTPLPTRPLPGAGRLPGASRLPGAPSRRLPGAVLPGTGSIPTEPGSDAAKSEAAASVEDLLPSDPLARERQDINTVTWRFVVTWRVELIRPEDARQAGQVHTAEAEPAAARLAEAGEGDQR